MARRDDELGNLGREKTLQVSDAFDFGNLLGHPLFESAVPCLKIGCLCRYSIVCLSQIGGALAQLVKQPGILDGDDGLLGENFHQLDLPVGEGPDFLMIDDDGSNQVIVLEHRHGDYSTNAPEFDGVDYRRITFHIRSRRCQIEEVGRLLGSNRLAERAIRVGIERTASACLGKCPRHIVAGDDAYCPAL